MHLFIKKKLDLIDLNCKKMNFRKLKARPPPFLDDNNEINVFLNY